MRRDLPPLPSAHEWTAALDLSQRGREWCGPCPLCGGEDRFHVRVRDGGCALVGCRGCLDGLAADARKRRFGELVAAVFPARIEARRGALAQVCRQPTSPARAKPRAREAARPGTTAPGAASGHGDERRIEAARRIWEAGSAADGTPARAYLAGRMAWPPDGVGPDLPDSVRWLAREVAPGPDKAASWYGLPDGCAGAILYAFTAGKAIRSVSLEALDTDGQRMATRWRRTIGSKAGALFHVAPVGTATGELVIAEGEVSAIAAAWLHPDGEALATGGAAGLRAWRPDPGDTGRPVIVAADGDASGRQAAATLQAALHGRQCRAAIRYSGEGQDPADELADAIDERAAILEHDGGMTRADALAAAWRDRMAGPGEIAPVPGPCELQPVMEAEAHARR